MLALGNTAEPYPARVSSLQPHAALSERQLAQLWEGQRFPPRALATRDGRPLRVIYRGRPGRGRGPDFRDAVIAAPWGLLRGDVELHARASDFRRHGHHRDPAYDGLALHVVFWDDEGEDTRLRCGRRVPVAALAPWVEGRARELRAWLSRPAGRGEPCRGALGRMGAAAVAAALDRMGDLRFREKAAAMRRGLAVFRPDDLLWRGLLEALGYGGDRAGFRRLGERLPWGALAAALGPLPAGEREGQARRLLAGAAGPLLAVRGHARPGNDPRRRLEAAARLAARFAGRGPAAALLPLVRRGEAEGPGALLAALAVPGCLGRSRAVEIAANVVLPLAAALGEGELAGAATGLYRRLPLPARYGAVRHLHQAVGGGVAVNARRQQGMLHLLGEYCTRGGCVGPVEGRGRCPLA